MRALLQGSMMQGLPYSSAQQTQPCRDNNIGYTDKVTPNHLRQHLDKQRQTRGKLLCGSWTGAGLGDSRRFDIFKLFFEIL